MLIPTLLLISVLTGIMVSQLQRWREQEVGYQSDLLKSRLMQNFEQAVSNLDTYRLAIPLRQHGGGVITLSDGSLNQISNHAGRLRPDSSSQALTTLRLASEHSLVVLRCHQDNENYTLEACFRHSLSGDPLSRGQVLALSSSNYSEFVGTSEGQGLCRTLRLRAGPSMISSHQPYPPDCSMHVLVPIEALYTLYLDKSGSLRYLSHRGQENIENQPLIGGIKTLSLILSEIGPYHLSHLVLDVETNQARRFQLSVFNHLSRDLSANYILNP